MIYLFTYLWQSSCARISSAKTRRRRLLNFVRAVSIDFTERLRLSGSLQAKSDHWYVASGKGKNTYIFFCRLFC